MIRSEWDLKVMCTCKNEMKLKDAYLEIGMLWFEYKCGDCGHSEEMLFEDLCTAVNEKGFYQVKSPSL